jgi:hypothetical protein
MRRSRILVLIAHDLYVRSFLGTGAFDDLGEAEVFFVASETVTQLGRLRERAGFVRTVADPQARQDAYAWLREILMVGYRFRSRTMAIKTSQFERWRRRKVKLYALPPIRRRLRRRILADLGPNADVEKLLDEIEPDLVIAPTAGTDALVLDMISSARGRGITTLVLINGWDNLASKATFPVTPDHIAVWGSQSVEHARRIHRFPRERVHAIGVPTFDGHLRFDRSSAVSPYPFRYVLFCGSALPFDELGALRALDDAIRSSGVDIRIVYRPHPWRQARSGDDIFRDAEFEHVVMDQQMREGYERSTKSAITLGPSDVLPDLEYYPALLAFSELVISPLSTMIVEAALLDRPSLAIAYDDGVHSVPPSMVAQFDHFEGIEAIEGIELCRTYGELPLLFVSMLGHEYPPLREQIQPWLYTDERSYGDRLRDLASKLLAAR